MMREKQRSDADPRGGGRVSALRVTEAFFKYWWASTLGLATVIGAVVALTMWETDIVLKSAVVGALVGAPAVFGAFLCGQTLGGRRVRQGAQAETWESSGVVRVVKRRQENARLPLPDLLALAKTELLVSGITLGQFRQYRGLILQKVEEGCTFRILLPDPRERPLFDKLGPLFEWHREITNEFISSLKTLKSLFQRGSTRFHVRLHGLIPTCSLVIADNHIGVIELYAYESSVDERILLEVEDGEVLRQYRRHFESMWACTSDLNESNFDEAIEAAASLSSGLGHP